MRVLFLFFYFLVACSIAIISLKLICNGCCGTTIAEIVGNACRTCLSCKSELGEAVWCLTAARLLHLFPWPTKTTPAADYLVLFYKTKVRTLRSTRNKTLVLNKAGQQISVSLDTLKPVLSSESVLGINCSAIFFLYLLLVIIISFVQTKTSFVKC